jgi:hypothetical protein
MPNNAVTTVNILLFFLSPTNWAESLLESQMNAKFFLLCINFSTFQALKWGFVIPKGQESGK